MGKLGVDSIGVKGDEETECLWRGLQHFCGGEKETLNENKVEEKRERKKNKKKKKGNEVWGQIIPDGWME